MAPSMTKVKNSPPTNCYANAPFDASDADIPYEVPSDPETAGQDLGAQDGSTTSSAPSRAGGETRLPSGPAR
jgi:hypothetical protein